MIHPIGYIYISSSPGNLDVWFCNAAGATDPDPLLIKRSGRQELHVWDIEELICEVPDKPGLWEVCNNLAAALASVINFALMWVVSRLQTFAGSLGSRLF
jgi:hypothetical protein